MPKQTAGLLVYRVREGQVEVFLVHPGGPFWAKKDAGAWSIPKGEVDENEDLLAAAQREFAEETGARMEGDFLPLGSHRTSAAKVAHVWALASDLDAAKIVSNTFKLEWPPKTGRWIDVPEVDRAGWFSWEAAAEKIQNGQREFLTRLQKALSTP